MNGSERPPLRRVVVALDPAAQCRAALDLAARLAAQSEAELVGLFVEESELLAAAALPVTRALRGPGAEGEALDPATMERGLRAWAAQAEATLASAAQRWRVKSSFRVARGRVGETLIAEAEGSDLLALGTVGRPSGRRRLGATARELARQAPCTLLLMRGEAHAGRPVLVLFEGDESALALAEQLARLDRSPMTILASDEERAEVATAWLDRQGRTAAVRVLEDDEPERASHLLETEPCGTVILERRGRLGAAIDAERVLAGPAASVILLG